MFRHSPEVLINQTHGPFLEVGGPSQPLNRPPSVNFGKITKPLIVSNVGREILWQGYWVHKIHPSLSNFFSEERPTGWQRMWYRYAGQEECQDDTLRTIERTPDLFADATQLPIATGKLGALYARGLHFEVERPFIAREAPRTLEPGGILVVENAKRSVVEEEIPSTYFNPIRSKKTGEFALNIVLQRNDVPYPTV